MHLSYLLEAMQPSQYKAADSWGLLHICGLYKVTLLAEEEGHLIIGMKLERRSVIAVLPISPEQYVAADLSRQSPCWKRSLKLHQILQILTKR